MKSTRDQPDKLELRRFEKSDIEQLLAWVQAPDFLIQWGGHLFSHPLNEEQVLVHLERSLAADSVCNIYKAVDGSERMVGYLELNRIDRQNRVASLSRVLIGESAQRGHAMGRALVLAALEVAFNELGLHRVDLQVYAQNEPAIRCYEGVGFKREGLRREVTLVLGEYWSAWHMSMLENEYAALHSDPEP